MENKIKILIVAIFIIIQFIALCEMRSQRTTIKELTIYTNDIARQLEIDLNY